MRGASASLLLAVGGCTLLHPATGPVIADRPGYTDTPTALPARAVQLEAGVTDDRLDDVAYQSAGEMLIRAGVGARTELRLFANSYGIRSVGEEPTSYGLEDFKLGAKMALHAAPDSVHGAMPRLALLVATTVPTGADNRTAHRAQPEAKLAAAWTTSGPFSIYGNLGYAGLYNGASWGTRGWGSLALWYALSPKVSLFGEGLAAGRVSGSASSSSDIDGGMTWLVNGQLQLDLRAGHGLGGSSAREHFFGAGVAWRW